MSSAGGLLWGPTPVSNPPNIREHVASITSDGGNGAVITWWREESTGTYIYDVYAARVSSTGAIPWGPTAIGNTPNLQEVSPQSTTDMTGGAIITWQRDQSPGVLYYDIYAQRTSNPAPTVTGLTPGTGLNTGTVSITDLSGTWFSDIGGVPDVSLKMAGQADIAATGVVVASSTQITCNFNITGAATGAWDVAVTNPDGQTDTLAGGFTVQHPAPTVTSITPNTGNRGSTVSVTNLAGTNFYGTPAVWLRRAGQPDINATNVIVVSPTRITCRLPIPAAAALGTRDVLVRNPDFQLGVLPGGFTVEHPAPTVTSITPNKGNRGQTVSVTNLAGTNFYGAPTVRLRRAGQPDINATNVVVVSPTKMTCRLPIPQNAAPGARDLYVRNPDGKSGSKAGAFTVNEAPVPPATTPTWYLAEGTTAWGFSCYITIENPNNEAVSASVTYMTDTGPLPGGDIDMPAMSQATINPRDILGARDFSTKVECKEGKTIAVDRTMSWTGEGAPSPEAHCSIGVTSPAETWYLPEGSSAWGFECWLLIQNPNDTEATATVTYMIEGEGPQAFEKKIPARSRKTYNMANDIGAKDASIKVEADKLVIPERAMYRNNRRGGHDSIGTTSPAPSYYLAEGTTAWGFTTYVLVQNPNESATDVTVTYMTSSGPVPQAPFTMQANSRKTIRVNDVMPGTDFSTQVSGTNPIIAERAMYWGEGTAAGEACHDSIGLSSPHTTFYLPDGQTSDGRETYTLVMNPNASDVTVEISYLTPDGTGNVTFQETVAANSRMTFSMIDKGIGGRAAVLVTSKTSGKKIMVERAMYWNSRGAGTDTIGGYSD